MHLLWAISLFCIAALFSPLQAQEAQDENIPGMRPTRDAPSRELTPEEREQLNNLFKGDAPAEKVPSTYVPSVPEPVKAMVEPEIVPLKNSSLYMDNTRVLTFRVLNKQTTRLYPLELNEGGSLTQGTLRITLIECWHSPPEVKDESAALLEITEASSSRPLYLGWMFASSPSLNPFEHPVYDLSIVECR